MDSGANDPQSATSADSQTGDGAQREAESWNPSAERHEWNHGDRFWRASDSWSWDNSVQHWGDGSWGSSWGQSTWNPSWGSWPTGGWHPHERFYKSWGFRDQRGSDHFGEPEPQGSEGSNEAGSDGQQRSSEHASENDRDHGQGDFRYARQTSSGTTGEAGSGTTGSTRATTRDYEGARDDGSSDSKGSFGEKMAVPSYDAEGTGEELGTGARSYLRQVAAWCRVTRTPKHQQALLLYQNLKGRAWVESEELQVEALSGPEGLEVFRAWIQERYLEVEVGKIADALTTFFRRLKRRPNQSVREFNSMFDRAYSRLLEIDCKLPEVAKAWAYMSSLGLTNSEELSLLASVNNEYHTGRLQKAAVLHEKSLRPAWQPRRSFDPKDSKVNGVRGAFLTGIEEDDEDLEQSAEGGGDLLVPEEAAQELHEAFVAQESAKARFREVAKARGVDPSFLGARQDRKPFTEEQIKTSVEQRLQAAKSRSYCAGCRRRGHWHRDPECPLNQGAQPTKPQASQDAHVTTSNSDDASGAVGNVVQVAYEVGTEPEAKLLAITDTACSKSVTGQSWLDSYIQAARQAGVKVEFVDAQDDFRFGASKLFRSTYQATIHFSIGGRCFMVRAAVVQGEVPLLLSRSVLSGLGMVYDVENGTAQFRHLGIANHRLSSTETGHPAIVVRPQNIPGFHTPAPDKWVKGELFIVPKPMQGYTVHMTLNPEASDVQDTSSHVDDDSTVHVSPAQGKSTNADKDSINAKIFYAKKIHSFVENFLSAEPMNAEIFVRWWSQTKLTKDFWIETGSSLIRIHVVPRRGLFNPSSWVTSQVEVKERLLRAIGCVRSTSAVSCESHHPLQPLHDLWEDNSEGTLPTLWIGRTIFTRATSASQGPSPVPSVATAPLDHGHPEHKAQGDLGDDQGGTSGACAQPGVSRASDVDGGRDQTGGVGEAAPADRRRLSPQGSLEYDAGPAQDDVCRATSRHALESYQGTAASLDQGPDSGPREHCRPIRATPGETLFGSTGIISSLDDRGNPAQRGQCLTRLDPPLELCEVPSGAAGEGDALRPRVQCQDPVCGVRGRGDLQSGKLVDGDVARGDREGERLLIPEQGSALGAEVHGQAEESRGPPGEEPDGSRCPRRCEGGTGVPYESPGSAQGSARSLEEEETDYENGDEVQCSSVEAEAATTDPVPGGPDGPGNHQLFSCLESQDDPNAIFLVDDLARRLWQEKNFDHDVCKRLVQRVCLECQAARKRKINEGTASVALGAYSHGNHYGVIKKSYMYPNVALYINKYMKTHGAKGQWTSFQLGWNCPTGPHKDVHNHDRSYNWTISVGSFNGGRLWLETNPSEVRDHPHLHQPVDLADGTQAIGEVIDTRERMYQFDPKRQHAVEAWSGDRAVITVIHDEGHRSSITARARCSQEFRLSHWS